jgi:hypothetical protein
MEVDAHDLSCPICHEPLRAAVCLSDGSAFDQECFNNWKITSIRGNENRSPKTLEPIHPSTVLSRNVDALMFAFPLTTNDNYNGRLVDAIAKCDFVSAVRALEQGADPNSSKGFRLALSHAPSFFLELLLDNGGDPDRAYPTWREEVVENLEIITIFSSRGFCVFGGQADALSLNLARTMNDEVFNFSTANINNCQLKNFLLLVRICYVGATERISEVDFDTLSAQHVRSALMAARCSFEKIEDSAMIRRVLENCPYMRGSELSSLFVYAFNSRNMGMIRFMHSLGAELRLTDKHYLFDNLCRLTGLEYLKFIVETKMVDLKRDIPHGFHDELYSFSPEILAYLVENGPIPCTPLALT